MRTSRILLALTYSWSLLHAGTIPVTNTNDSGSGTLRAAVNAAQTGDTIVFSLPTGSTITLTSGELGITVGLTIQGPGAGALTINGNQSSRIFNITSANSVTISGLTLTGGAPSIDAYGGGAILIDTGESATTVNLTDMVVIHNDVTSAGNPLGGGIDNEGGTVTIMRSSIVNNISSFRGGGIQNQGFGSMTIINSTIANNTAGASGIGGGIRSLLALTLTDCTVYGNSAQTAGNLSSFAGGVDLQNTIVAGGVLLGGGGTGADLNGNFNSLDYNLIQDLTSAIISGTTAHSITGVSPRLGTLGGTPPVLTPQEGSPALGAGTAAAGVSVDERGVPRPAVHPDIGAVEVTPAPAPISAPALSAGGLAFCGLLILILSYLLHKSPIRRS
ncbi:MAG TPA: choice-of-anchor Q domain-containing protein [Bryobacteraceae bacterium]|jgi:hypothetical protein|nr:choice-of-anchor Q domain-containing protein [Bryobacteraceae bacterium]